MVAEGLPNSDMGPNQVRRIIAREGRDCQAGNTGVFPLLPLPARTGDTCGNRPERKQNLELQHECQRRCGRRPRPRCRKAGPRLTPGRRIVTLVPSPGALPMAIDPPCSSIIFFTVARPRPVPAFFVVKNGSNTLSTISGGIGTPSFLMRI